jgi:hypothetical protein
MIQPIGIRKNEEKGKQYSCEPIPAIPGPP